MKIVKFGEAPTDKVRNKTVRGVSFTANLIHAVLNTDFVAGDLDWSQIMLKVSLVRKGRAQIIGQDNLRNLCAGTNYFNPVFLTAKSFMNGLIPTATKGVGAYAQATSQVVFDFGAPINVHEGDELHAEVQCPLQAVVAANVNSNTSSIQMDWVLGVGHEFATPFVRTHTLQAAEQNQNVTMGNDIVEIVLLNFDKSDALLTTSVVVSATLKNNKYTPTWQYQQLLGRKHQTFPTSAEATLRHQSFCIYDNDRSDLDGCELQLQMNTAQVAASQNVVVYRGLHFNDTAFERGHAGHQADQAARVDKVYGRGAVAQHTGASRGRG
jgi:hypothetical protein